MRDILRLRSVDDLILEKAYQRVRDAMYGSPEQYFSYQKSVLGFEHSETVWRGFVEIKATRDVYIHGDGHVNEVYLKKLEAWLAPKLAKNSLLIAHILTGV
jgi:hypothetical protein